MNFLILLVLPVFFVLGLTFGAFLFWRLGRHELVESEILLDTIIVAVPGALVFSRILDWMILGEKNGFSLTKLFFFNAYGGFDYYGALFGGLFAVWLYLRKKKYSFWFIMDLAAGPLAFVKSFVLLGYLIVNLLHNTFLSVESRFLISMFLSYFVLFFVLMRLAQKRRHVGFFISLFLVASGIIDSVIYFAFGKSVVVFGTNYQVSVSVLIFIVAIFVWFVLSKRKLRNDIKSVFSGFLLSVFKLKRALSSVSEADALARSIILLPLQLARFVVFLVKLLFSQIVAGLIDTLRAFGIKRTWAKK